MSDSVWPHRRQPTRLPHPWDSPGKNTGVGCHFFSNAWKWKVKSESEVAQSCPTPSNPMDCSLPGSSVYGIFQARVLEWGAIAFSKSLGWSFLAQQPGNKIFIFWYLAQISPSEVSPDLPRPGSALPLAVPHRSFIYSVVMILWFSICLPSPLDF